MSPVHQPCTISRPDRGDVLFQEERLDLVALDTQRRLWDSTGIGTRGDGGRNHGCEMLCSAIAMLRAGWQR